MMATGQSIAPLAPPPPQWVLDLNSSPAPKPKSTNIIDPPGFTAKAGKVGQRIVFSLSFAKNSLEGRLIEAK